MRRLFLAAVLLMGTFVGLIWLANFDLGPLFISAGPAAPIKFLFQT